MPVPAFNIGCAVEAFSRLSMQDVQCKWSCVMLFSWVTLFNM